MSKDRERPGAAPLDQVKRTIHSDLQYVSLQMDGKTYGGWYRMLSDGRMELLALANMHSERRPESTPIEQARGMLEDFIRARPKESALTSNQDGSDASEPSAESSASNTLGDLLYADTSKARVAERTWVELVEAIARSDQGALHRLFEQTYRIVFTLLMRLTKDAEAAEELTMDAFHRIWRGAHRYDATQGTVVGWIMNHAQSVALDALQARSIYSLDEEEDPHRQGTSTDVLSPATPLWPRLVQRIALESGHEPLLEPSAVEEGPEWEEVAPGITCKLLATEADQSRVSMLVRLAPGVEYPPHSHAGVEELHLLHGELWIDERKLVSGDYNRAEPGTADKRVWSETGCMCVLMTSPRDVLS